MTNKHGYGWKPDIPDHRDYMFGAIHKPMTEKLPTSVDLRSYCSKIEDQGNLGSCTAQALVGSLEFLENKDKIHFEDLSRLFVYYQERVLENSVDYDSGAMLRDGIKALARWGDCSELHWKYDISKFASQPPKICYAEAVNHKILQYARLLTIADMKSCLASGFPFSFGFSVYESFESDYVAKTGIVPMPSKNEQLLGGHAVLAVGYDMNKKIFPESIGSVLCRNSWGVGWGQCGYFLIPFEYLTNRNLSDDLWTIRIAKGM